MGIKTKNKDVNKIISDKVREGWTVQIGKHIKLYHPDGGFVSISKSPSCHWALKNIKGDIARLEKENRRKLNGHG